MVKNLAYSSTLESMMIFNFMTMKCFRDTFEWAKNIETFFSYISACQRWPGQKRL